MEELNSITLHWGKPITLEEIALMDVDLFQHKKVHWWACVLFLSDCYKVMDRRGHQLQKREIMQEMEESYMISEMPKDPRTHAEFLFDCWASRSYDHDDFQAWSLRYAMMEYYFGKTHKTRRK